MRLRAAVLSALLVARVAVFVVGAQESDGEPDPTIRREILTASFYELSALAEEAGLSTRGNRVELENRLLAYYGFDPEAAVEGTQERRLVIEEAQQLRYLEDEATEQRYVRMTGGVFIRLSDPDEGVTHTILADEVVYNEDTEVVTALGDVEYTIERETDSEVFRGQGLSFNLENYEGLFLDGISRRTRTVDGRELEFSFEGRTLARSATDVVVLEGGIITSSAADPPNYFVSAERVWVLAPGEWALEGAVLHVGRVPMLPLPFFFHPADEIVFHPSTGFRPIAGPFVQTTTYLYGQREPGDSPLSILNIAEEEDDDAPRVQRGIFLRRSTRAPARDYPESWVLKLLADAYGYRGVFVGVEALLPGGLGLDRLDVTGGLAVSREVYAVDGAYSPLYRSASPGAEFTSYVQNSYLFGGEVPIRFGLDASASVGFEFGTASLQLPVYSDPLFRSDFYRRSEDIQWLRMLGLGEEESAAPGRVGSFRWQLSVALTPTMSATAPFLQTLSLSPLSLSLSFRSATVPTTELDEARRSAVDSPMQSFFVPDTLVTPDLALRLAGTILQLPAPAGPSEPSDESGPDDAPQQGIRPPWEEETPSETEPPVEEEEQDLLPPIQGNLPVSPPADALRLSVGYQFAPAANVGHTFNTADWRLPSDVDAGIRHSNATFRGTATLNYNLALPANLLTVTGSTGATGQYRGYFGRAEPVQDSEWSSLIRSAASFTSFGLSTDVRISSQPLAYVPLLAGSTLSYDLATVLLRTDFQDLDEEGVPVYESSTAEWTDEFIRTHNASLNLAARPAFGAQSLRLTATLPPLTGRLSAAVSTAIGPFALTAGSALREEGETWVWDNLSLDARFAEAGFTISQNLVVDLRNERVNLLSGELAYEGLRLSGLFRYNTGFEFGGVGVGWVPTGVEEFRAVGAGLSADLPLVSGRFWRNRLDLALRLNTGIDLSFLRFTDSFFTFGLSFSLSIFEFMDLEISTSSRNSEIYRYVPGLAEEVGRTSRDIVLDLLRSFNFFNVQDRVDSFFNLQRLSISLVHYLGDWDLTLEYSGAPRLTTDSAGRRVFEWGDSLNISLSWKPIPEIASDIAIDQDRVEF